MHKSILTFLLFFSVLGFSQIDYLAENYELKISSEIKYKTLENFDGVSEGFVFISGVRKGTVYVSKVDPETLNSVWSTELDEELKQGKTVFKYYNTILSDGKTHIIYKGYNEKENDLTFIEKVLDQNGAIVKSVVIAHFPVYENNDHFTKVFTTPDKQHYFLRVITGTNGMADLKSHFVWLDKSFNILEQDYVNTKQKGAYSSIESESISNQLNYALTVSSKKKFDTDLLIYNHFKGKGKISHTLKFENLDLLSSDIAFNPYNDEITISGYYGQVQKDKNLIQGFFHSVFNRNNFDSISEQRFDIDELMHKDLKSDLNAVDKFFSGGKGHINIKYLDTYFTESKGKYVAYEVLEKFVTRDAQGFSSIYYKPKDFLIMYYNSDHIFDFYTAIPASEVSTVSSLGLHQLELNGFIEDDNLLFYFGMNGKQCETAFPGKEELLELGNRQIALLQATVSHTQSVEVKTILIYKATLDQLRFDESGIKKSLNPFDFYLTFYGGSSWNKTTLYHLFRKTE